MCKFHSIAIICTLILLIGVSAKPGDVSWIVRGNLVNITTGDGMLIEFYNMTQTPTIDKSYFIIDRSTKVISVNTELFNVSNYFKSRTVIESQVLYYNVSVNNGAYQIIYPENLYDTCYSIIGTSCSIKNVSQTKYIQDGIIAALTFVGCEEGKLYDLKETDFFTSNSSLILSSSKVSGNEYCINNKTVFYVSHFSSYSTNPSDYIFYDDAESGTLSTKWGFLNGASGWYTANQSFEGTRSIRLLPGTAINHSLTTLVDSVYSWRVYTHTANTSGYWFDGVGTWNNANHWGLGIHNPKSTSKWAYGKYGLDWIASPVSRITGWAEFKVVINSSHATMYVNDTIVNQTASPTIPTDKYIQLYAANTMTHDVDLVRIWNWTLYGIDGPQSTPASTCTYSGTGNWGITASDWCNITTSTVVQTGFNVTCSGTGILNLLANITNWKVFNIHTGCNVSIHTPNRLG